MMLAVNGFTYYNLKKFRGHIKDTWQRIGPFVMTMVAAPLIMADLTRHVLSDTNVWPWCGDNETFPRINKTWDDACFWSSTQYKCDMYCCVPEETWGHSVGIDVPLGEGEDCACEDCVVHETMSHLSFIGWLFTICFTYTGFIFLAVGIMWNSDMVKKVKLICVQWRELRGQAASPESLPIQAKSLDDDDDDDDAVIYEKAT